MDLFGLLHVCRLTDEGAAYDHGSFVSAIQKVDHACYLFVP